MAGGWAGAQGKHRMELEKLAQRLFLLTILFIGIDCAVRVQDADAFLGLRSWSSQWRFDAAIGF